MSNLKNELKKWKNGSYDPAIAKRPSRQQNFTTSSGSEISPLYIPDEEFDYHKKLGFPGNFPFTRGVQPSMYRSKNWTMRQYAGFGSAEDTNQRFKYLLESGTTGLSVAFDLPTQIGYDSDHQLAEGEIGKVGVPVSSLKDMEVLLQDIPLDNVSTSMTINSTAAILLAFYIAVAKKANIALSSLSGTIQNDILKEYIARGTYIYPPDSSLRIITDIFKYCNENLPRWNTISISGYHIREAGSSAVQEIAFTLSNAIEYTKAAISSGLDINKFASRVSFFFNAHNNFFEEVAKFRAARRIWAAILKTRFDATDENAMRMRFHAQTAGSTLTAQQPENNLIRVTMQALAAVLGGTQSLHTNSYDEALALPTEESVLLALRTQQIIAHETGVTDTIDPLGGSYFLEKLTDEIEEKVYEYIKQVDDLGGAVEAIKSGYFQDEIAHSAYEIQKDIENGDSVVVGINKFQTTAEQNLNTLKIDKSMIARQLSRLKEVKLQRDGSRVSEALNQLDIAAQSENNIMPYIINCVECYTTLGEISDCLRGVLGNYEEK
jgi:methylmalonyl-CoA mutase N-terminal domain/subunit